MEWIETSERPLGNDDGEVIGYHPDWICPDFNPKGTRVGFVGGDGDFISAEWFDYQDTYQNAYGTMPTHYCLMPGPPMMPDLDARQAEDFLRAAGTGTRAVLPEKPMQ